MEQITARPHTTLQLGRAGENGVRQVLFDLTAFARLGPGRAELVAALPGDSGLYPIPLTQGEERAVWLVTAAETARAGSGRVQLRYLVGDKVAKTEVYDTWVAPGMDEADRPEPPQAQQSWMDRVLEAGRSAEESARRAEQEADRAGQSAGALIDDRVLTTDRVLSGRRTAELLGEPFSVTGPVVTCQPLEGYPLEVFSGLEVRQAGEGTPSLTNIRPITQHHALTLTQEGGTVRTCTIQLDRAVCRGVFDWSTGELTVLSGLLELPVSAMNNSEDYPGWKDCGISEIIGREVKNPAFADIPGVKNADLYGFVANVKDIYDSGTIYTATSRMTQTEWKARYPDLVMQFAVEYAPGLRPVLRLDPRSITALSGVNRLYSDTGDTTVRGVSRPAIGLAERMAEVEHMLLEIRGGEV